MNLAQRATKNGQPHLWFWQKQDYHFYQFLTKWRNIQLLYKPCSLVLKMAVYWVLLRMSIFTLAGRFCHSHSARGSMGPWWIIIFAHTMCCFGLVQIFGHIIVLVKCQTVHVTGSLQAVKQTSPPWFGRPLFRFLWGLQCQWRTVFFSQK